MNTAYYVFTSGLPGCLPDYNSGAMAFTTRRDLSRAIRAELEILNYPKSCFADVCIEKLWGFIKRHGSSTAHRAVYHGDRVFEMHGLTESEYNAMLDADCA